MIVRALARQDGQSVRFEQLPTTDPVPTLKLLGAEEEIVDICKDHWLGED
jgi:hypothetical protein